MEQGVGGSGNDEVRTFAASAAASLDRVWTSATAAATASLEEVRAEAVKQGWFQLGEAGALDFLIAVERELGRRACPLGVADAYVAVQIFPGLADAVAEGTLRPVVAIAPIGTEFAHLDDAAGSTHVLRLSPDGTQAELLPVIAVQATEGLAIPTWHAVTTGPAERSTATSGALAVVILCRAARAMAAAGRVHRLAADYAVTRHQFGKAIGAFGAVQQRVAAAQVDLTAGEALIDEAVRCLVNERPEAGIAVDLAVRFAADHATAICFAGQHTLGAIGYFEEHEAPWLFRRVHADVLTLGVRGAGVLARRLVDDQAALPHLDLGAKAEAFREEVHRMLDRHTSAGAIDPEPLRTEMTERGLFSMGWPSQYGGIECTVEEQVVLHDELKYAGGPVDRAMSATMLIGHSLLRHGTDEQKKAFLPLLHAGQMAFCLGYSEPEAGSDLASLRTRAVPDGEEWVINGQKIWTTRGHTASHVWLAVRTNPDATPRHAGITIFLVSMDTPGIEIHQHVALSGEVSCSVFFDDVRVPDSCRVGEIDGGWKVITDALAAERVVMGGIAATMRRHFDAVLAVLRRAPQALDAAGRDRLESVAARLQAARVVVVAATQGMRGDEARLLGPIAAVLSGELAEQLGEVLLGLLGPAGALSLGMPGSMAGVEIEAFLRLSPMYVIGGGTNDIQRGIIARALGLPRE